MAGDSSVRRLFRKLRTRIFRRFHSSGGREVRLFVAKDRNMFGVRGA